MPLQTTIFCAAHESSRAFSIDSISAKGNEHLILNGFLRCNNPCELELECPAKEGLFPDYSAVHRPQNTEHVL